MVRVQVVVVSGRPAADGPARRVLTAAPMADAGAELARVIHATIERFGDLADSARVDEIVTAMAQFGITTLDSLRIILDDAGSRGALSVALGDAVKPAFPFLLLSVLKVRARVFARVDLRSRSQVVCDTRAGCRSPHDAACRRAPALDRGRPRAVACGYARAAELRRRHRRSSSR